MSSLKTKEKPKKIDAKELELQRMQEEARRREEEERKRQEELRKYEVIVLSTGLKLILTQYCITEAWKNPKPKDFLADFMGKYFKKAGLLDNFESLEVNILAEFHLFNLIFAKEELALDDFRTTVLVNLFWEILMNGNSNYAVKQENNGSLFENSRNFKENLEKSKGKKSSIMFKEKGFSSDLEYFQRRLSQHSVIFQEMPSLRIFQVSQSKAIMDFAINSVFSHYKLYENIFNNKQKNEEILIKVHVDTPLLVEPLNRALFMGKDRIEIKDEDEEYQREIAEKAEQLRALQEKMQRKLEENKEKLEFEQSSKYKTLKIIKENIQESRELWLKEVKEKEEVLQKTAENLVNTKKK